MTNPQALERRDDFRQGQVMRNRLLDVPPTPQRVPAESQSSWGQASSDQLQRLQRTVGNFIAGHPGLTLGTALAVGVVIGWLIKRRS